MAKLEVVDLSNKKVGEIDVSDAVFGTDVNEALLYEYVRMQDACRRSGTAKIKGRGEVRGGGRKPFRQKGTGRARQGSIRSPIHVGGGTVHGPTPRSYAYKLPKSARRGAIRSALSLRSQGEKLVVVDDIQFDEIKTKRAAQVLQETFGFKSALIVDGQPDGNFKASVRNIPGFKVLPAEGVNVRDVLLHDTLVVTREAVAKLERRLS